MTHEPDIHLGRRGHPTEPSSRPRGHPVRGRRLFEEPVLLRFGPDDTHGPLRLERAPRWIGVDEGLAHLLGVFGVHAEDDRLRLPIADQHLHQMLSDGLGAVEKRDQPLELSGRVHPFRDPTPKTIDPTPLRRPPVRIDVEQDQPDPVGREVPVLDSLAQRVLEDGLAEVSAQVSGLNSAPRHCTGPDRVAGAARAPGLRLCPSGNGGGLVLDLDAARRLVGRRVAPACHGQVGDEADDQYDEGQAHRAWSEVEAAAFG